jgi:transcriptional regulator with XRE-family HTH domain
VSEPRNAPDAQTRLRDRIDGIRLLAGMSRDELADALKIQRGTFRAYFRTRRRFPEGVPERAAAACGVPPWLADVVLYGNWADATEALHTEAAERAKMLDDVVAAHLRRRRS